MSTPPAADRALFVPVSVHALVVPDAPVQVVSVAPRFELFGFGYRLGGSMRAEPWETDADVQLEPGVHLHWRLPAALSHGEQTPGDAIEFPPVPNRWLVLRVAADDAPREWTRAWVVQSDTLGTDATNATIARSADGAYVGTRIGRQDPYDAAWVDARPTASQPLTAIGPGDPTFAAFYPGCRNVFGYHDTLDDVPAGTFLYLVAGWYAPRDDDPLGPDKGQPARAARRSELERQWLGKPAAPDRRPTRTVCHGAVHGVTWRQGERKLGAIPEGPAYRVSVGNTAAEALAALVAAPADRGHLWEPLLSAFQYDILTNLDVRRGMPDLDAELHRRRFHAVEGGTKWVMRPLGDPAISTPGASASATPPFPRDPDIATTFDALVEAQRQRDAIDRELLSLRSEYHAAWYGSEVRDSPESARFAARLPELEREIRSKTQDLGEKDKAIRDACASLQAKGLGIPGAAAAPAPSARYELVSTPMPWFWRAADPAILLARPGDPGAHRYARDDQHVTGRSVDELVGALTVTLSGKRLAVTMPAWALPLARRDGSAMPFSEIAALYREALLLDPARARAIAAGALADHRAELSAAMPLLDDATTAVVAAQRAARVAEDVVAPWEPGWHPLFVVWEMEWAPGRDGVMRQFTLRDNTEYRWAVDDTVAPQVARTYRGWAPLSLSLSAHLLDRLHEAPQEVTRAFASWMFLAQAAAGLTDALIMREEALHLPPLRSGDTVDQDRLALFGAASRWSPLGRDPLNRQGFFPIRGGHARIVGLQLVDEFGRGNTVIGAGGVDPRAHTVVTGEAVTGTRVEQGSWIALPPRIVQPARLLARWVSAAHERTGDYRESSSNPATSPILGWIVPNHLDGSLLVYDALGRLRGELQKGAAGPAWMRPPGSDAGSGDGLESDSPHLAAFVDGLVRAGGEALRGLLALIDRVSLCITTPLPQPALTEARIAGQPLVLARASLVLEPFGRLATDPRADATGDRTGGTGALRFPVLVGDLRKSSDSVIGCFVGRDYTRIRPPFATPRNDTTYFAFDDGLTVGLGADRIDVTLLLDPRGSVHVASGILPATTLELPGPLVAEALERLEPTIRMGPVLGGDPDFRLPVPDDVGGSWTWVDLDRSHTPRWQPVADVGKPEPAPGVPARALRIRDGWLSFKRAETKRP